MDIIQFNKVNKSFLDKPILKNVTFNINDKDKIGLIGLNGAGKSTIINIIKGTERIDNGDVFVNPNVNISYLSQEHNFSDENNTVLEELKSAFAYEFGILSQIEKINAKIQINEDLNLLSELEKLNNIFLSFDGYNLDYRIKQVLNGLELDDMQENIISNLSGGEKTRVSLAKLLLKEPELLILDEPTNHLDLASIEWLENFLLKYNKAFLLVSHDRVFLDNVCNRIFELENKELYKYNGNFSDFIIQKEMIIKGKLKAFEKEQDRIKKLEEYIERNRAGRMAKQAKGREKILNRIDRIDDPIFNIKRMKLKFIPKSPTAQNVLIVKNICKNFDDKNVLNDISFNLYKGERVGIIGKNGSGKSTLLKIITNKIKADNGEITLGSRVNVASYDQNNEDLGPDNTILQEINTSINYTEEYLRSMAGGFLFTKDDIEKRISSLSGGEKVRVSFIKMLQKQANFLILDEPTNHLDIYSIEILENALEDFEGSILLVSHNRHFIDSVCNIIYILDENGLTKFKGNYEEYKKSLISKNDNTKSYSGKLNYTAQKEKLKRINKIKKEIENIEKRSKEIELEKDELNKKMFISSIATNAGKLVEIQEKLNSLNDRELNLLEKWEQLQNELEEINE
ncbi:ABC-F family ATP-binding cassette domain-containing protein [Oceanivirga salmonicida]|uniref:ABC-F family ATP-binding cassette domain-containing protein n=1 Tax=Oceanivirga salmonicida TaxID=1769291 RepID=UPI000833381B|nr:ABC-F family ATP-binding cassette domain-containing protein [Oceanivirga salmonicida]